MRFRRARRCHRDPPPRSTSQPDHHFQIATSESLTTTLEGTMETAVEVRGLRVVRGGTEVLPEPVPDGARGRITGLLGPSGCGKTTLMRAIVGVQIVEAGDVTVLGEPAGSAAAARAGSATSPRRRPSTSISPCARTCATSRAFSARPTRRVDRDPPDRQPAAHADRSGATLRRAASAVSLGDRAARRQPDAAGARRAHRRARPGPARATCGSSSAGSPTDGTTLLRLEPRHGRGGPLRPPAAHARGPRCSQTSPRPSCARRPGEDDMERAFLRLIEREAAAA